MKGIVLAGGSGSRLWPVTQSISKQLLPIYDKPMIYYPISTLMLAGVREILIITTPHDKPQFVKLLRDGSDFGISIEYATQVEPKGLAEAFTIGEDFLAGDTCLMILGDNIFHGVGMGNELVRALPESGCHIFTYKVANPSEYGILTIDENQKPISIIEKPPITNSNLAVTGIYFFDSRVSELAKQIVPSARGELEITSLIQKYLDLNELTFTQLTRGVAWLDTGRPKSLHDAASFVRVIEDRTGLKIGCPEEIALGKGWITKSDVLKVAKKMHGSEYGAYLLTLAV